MKFLRTGAIAAFGAAALMLAGAANADYPEKPITMIVAYSPGGGTDTAARVIAKYVDKYLGQRLVIENKPGAGGQIGFSALASANPDGYQIGFINVPSIQLVKKLRDNVPYKMSDFAPIANIQLDPVVIAVNADSPYKTLDDLIKAAKADPGALNVGADGPQSNNQLQMLIAEKALGVSFNFIAFNGSGPAIKATLGNEVAASFPSASSAVSNTEAGRLRILGVFADEESPLYPGVPTVSAATGTDVPSVGASLRGIAAPAGISPEHLAKLEKVFAEVMKDPDFLAQAKATGLPLKYMNAADFSAYLKKSDEALDQFIPLMK